MGDSKICTGDILKKIWTLKCMHFQSPFTTFIGSLILSTGIDCQDRLWNFQPWRKAIWA